MYEEANRNTPLVGSTPPGNYAKDTVQKFM